MQVGESAFFAKAVFAGSVNFSDVKITGTFEAHEAQFTNTEQSVSFYSSR